MSGMPQNLNVAIFIDADNAPSRKIGDVLAELASYGSVSIRRAYGNWKNASLEPWARCFTSMRSNQCSNSIW